MDKKEDILLRASKNEMMTSEWFRLPQVITVFYLTGGRFLAYGLVKETGGDNASKEDSPICS